MMKIAPKRKGRICRKSSVVMTMILDIAKSTTPTAGAFCVLKIGKPYGHNVSMCFRKIIHSPPPQLLLQLPLMFPTSISVAFVAPPPFLTPPCSSFRRQSLVVRLSWPPA
jgi:hypothetical protein